MKLLILLGLTSTALAASQCGVHLQWKPRRPSGPSWYPWQPNQGHGRYGRSIIGGKLVPTPEKWPWQVYLEEHQGDKINFCTGTVISEQWVLTAAHCLTRGIANVTYAISGVTHRDQPQRTELSVDEVIKHPGYNRAGGQEHDIALLKVDQPFVFNNLVAPICLPSPAQSIANDARAVATGFGKTDKREASESDLQLREVMVPIVPNDACQKRWSLAVPTELWSKRKIICASSLEHGTAKGDSGGPLMMKASDGRWFQIGVTSIGAHSELEIFYGETHPDIFTDVRKYCDWIKENTNGEVSCQEEEVVLEDVGIQA